ncbi:MAG TPA: ABC transporter permease [Thermoleophilia bacterium]|nr:ABC transporter permease [Actinomycetota bacterium]HOU27960.1 ABC transporter permease [Thermoleophilia bacterium]HQH22272.1 ABC transporter permease [Thermoleophilia bacterium]
MGQSGLRVVLKLTWIELKLFLREPMTIVFTFAFPVVLMFVLGEIFGGQADADADVFGRVGAMNYYAPAYIAVVAMSVGVIMLPARLTDYRSGGVLRRFRASLVPVWAVLGSQVLGALVLAVVGGVLVVGFAAAFYPVHFPDSLGLLAAGFLICSAAFAAVGTLLGAVMPSPRAAQGAGLMLFFVMLFLSGASVPTEIMSPTMTRIGEALPLTYGVDLLQGAWIGGTWDRTSALVLLVVAAVAGLLSLRLYRWD